MSEIASHPLGQLPAIQAAVERLGADFLSRPGGIFYSGRAAFAKPSPIYFLGLNPGGAADPGSPATIRRHYNHFLERQTLWSEYLDESWEGAEAGTWGM